MSEPLKPQFFVVRENGNIVPLIAMDEMPHNIRVEGVLRTMGVKDTVGMTNIGEYPSRHSHHQVQDTNKASSSYNYTSTRPRLARDTRLDEQAVSAKSANFPVELFAPLPGRSYGIQEQPPTYDDLDNIIHNTNTKIPGAFGQFDPLPPWKDMSQVEGLRNLPRGKKVFCSHWMTTGECDYAQQGCKYKHEMPLDLETLNFLGYKDIPKWYREHHGIGSLLAVPGSGAAISGPTLRSNAMSGSIWRASSRDNRPSRPQTTTGTPTTRDRSSTGPIIKAGRGIRGRARELQHHDHQSRQVRTLSLIVSERAERPPRTQNIPDVRSAIDQLFKSKHAPARPTPNTATLLRITPASLKKHSNTMMSGYNAHTPQTSSASPSPVSEKFTRTRSTSIFSDIEADIIRANDLRKFNDEAAYTLQVAKAKEAELNEHSKASKQDDGDEKQKEE